MEPSEFRSCIDVRWKMKKPELSDWIRSQYFHLRGNELCLELHHRFVQISRREIAIRAIWRRRPTNLIIVRTYCYLITGREVYYSHSAMNKQSYPNCEPPPLVDEILTARISDDPSMDSEEKCFVKCQLSLDALFESHAEREKIELNTVDDTLPRSSFDKCVQVSSKIPQDMEALSHDLAHLFKEKILPDFKLSCGGQTFPVHRCILAARSNVFRAMFSNQMQESITGLVDIEDLEVPILKLLLKYVYSGKLEDISLETASQLYEAADKYAVKSLMAACSYYMIRNMTEENCVGYLKTADSHSDPDLEAAVASFIMRHPAVFESPSWANFSMQDPVLANEVLQDYVASISQ